MNQTDKIEKAINELALREHAFASAVIESAEAEGTYRQAKAEAYLKADGTIPEKEMQADKQCQAEYARKLIADAMERLTKNKLEDCRAVLSARQSLLSAELKVHQATKNFTA